MARPEHLADVKTRFFLDSSNINELNEMVALMGFSDGVTTNPTLVKKAPEIQRKLEQDLTLTGEELLQVYREIAQGLSARIPDGSVSLEVYADKTTTADEMFEQGRRCFLGLQMRMLNTR